MRFPDSHALALFQPAELCGAEGVRFPYSWSGIQSGDEHVALACHAGVPACGRVGTSDNFPPRYFISTNPGMKLRC